MTSPSHEPITEKAAPLFLLQWEPCFADHAAAVRDSWRTRFVRKLEIGMAILMAALGLCMMVLLIRTHDGMAIWAALYAFGVAVYFSFGLPLIFIPIAWIQYRANPRFRDPYTVTIEEEHIRIKTPMSDLCLAWSYYQRAIEGRQTFLLVAERNFTSLIPKRIFRDEAEIASFRQFVTKKLAGNR